MDTLTEEIKIKNKKFENHTRKIISLVSSENYTQLLKYFTRLLRRTRRPLLKKNRIWIGVVQMGMLRNLPNFQEDLQKFKIEYKTPDLDEKTKKELEDKIIIYQEWIRIFHTIMDGIAWRVLNFNRPIIRLLSENQGSGFISNSYAKILNKFTSTKHGISIINDLTHCLRIGDITHITKDEKILLYELKKDGKKKIETSDIFEKIKIHGPSGVSRQDQRHLIAQMGIINNSIEIPVFKEDGTSDFIKRADIVNSDIEIQAHICEIKNIIKKADKSGFEQKELEEGYFIEITAWDTVSNNISNFNKNSDNFIKRKKDLREDRPKWLKNKESKVISLSSTESFYVEDNQYPRNLTPQSVLPFSSKDCVRIMMGCLEVKVFFSVDILKNKFEKDGWKVEFLDHESNIKIERPGVGSIKDFMCEIPSEDFLKISKSNDTGTYHSIVPITLIFLVMTSYYKMNFVIDAVEDGFNRGEKEKAKNRQVAINFTKEKEILI